MKTSRRYILLCLVTMLMQLPLYGQTRLSGGGGAGGTRTKKTKAILKEWRMSNDYGIADSVVVDTAAQNYPMRNVLNNRSIAWAYNGNLISPTQSKVYFDRSGNGLLSPSGTGGEYWTDGGLGKTGSLRQKTDFLFAAAYEPYILTAQEVPYHRTTIAYSDIAYKKGFTTYHEENDLSFSFTGNINPRTNLGTKITYLNSPGHYTNQEGKVVNGCIYGSYDGNHYGLHAAFGFNLLSNFENGGLQDVSLLGGSLNSEDLPVNLYAMSGFKHIFGVIDHHYSITVEREEKRAIRGRRGEADRDTTITVHVPVTTFNHVFEVNNSTKRYIEKNARQSFFSDTYLNPSSTSDTANVLNIRNTLAVTFNEEFNRLLHFGATVYATNEFQRYIFGIGQRDTLMPIGVGNIDADALMTSMHLMPDTLYGQRWVNNTWVGGSIYKNHGKWVRFGVNGDVCLAGNKLGEFQVNGHVDGTFPIAHDSLLIRATVYVKNETPSYYLQHYRSNHYLWENNFNKTYRFYVGGEVVYPSQWFKAKAKVGFENLTNYIYFDSDGKPLQHSGNIQIIAGEARFDVTTPWINLENTVVIQHSSSTSLPLPTIALYNNLYYHGWWFKRAMYAQMGANVRYHTAYYAPVLNPALGQFCVQQDTKVGNYPIINLYANFYVKLLKLKFFAEWQHFNWYFMKQSHAYLSMPGYAMNPSVFRAGLAWHFWR